MGPLSSGGGYNSGGNSYGAPQQSYNVAPPAQQYGSQAAATQQYGQSGGCQGAVQQVRRVYKVGKWEGGSHIDHQSFPAVELSSAF